jgi:hypothetical protein
MITEPLSLRLMLEHMIWQRADFSDATVNGYAPGAWMDVEITLVGAFEGDDRERVMRAVRTLDCRSQLFARLPPIGAHDVKPEQRAQLLRELIACASPAELEDCAVRVDAALSGRAL